MAKLLIRNEEVLLEWAGKIIMFLGFFGELITLFFDEMRMRPIEYDWLQIIGMIAFIVVILFGVAVDNLLKTIRDILKDV